jgi:prophage maintenance system killer protein
MLDTARYVAQERKSGLRAPARLRRLYRDAHENAAALLHSLARNRPLVAGKKRLALTGRRDDDRPRL